MTRPDKLCAFARGVMTEHLSPSSLERFPDRSVSAEILLREVRHLEVCPDCHKGWREALARQSGRDPATIAAAAANDGETIPRSEAERDRQVDWSNLDWLAEEHLTLEELTALETGRMGDLDREMAVHHLRGCPDCCQQQQLARSLVQPAPGNRARRLALVFVVVLLLPVLSLLACLAYYAQPNSVQSPLTSPPVSPEKPEMAHRLPGAAPKIQQPQPEARRREGAPLAIVLRDGGRRITLDRAGRLTGLPELSPPDRRWIARTLRRGHLSDPGITDLLHGEHRHHRSYTSRGVRSGRALRLLSPPASVLITSSPLFEWEPNPEVSSWMVELTQLGGSVRIVSPLLDGSDLRWGPPEALPRGSTWRITLRGRGRQGELQTTSRIFRILGSLELSRFEATLRQTNSHLARGLLAARLGLIPEAVAEFRQLDSENPNNLLIKRFLLQLLAESLS